MEHMENNMIGSRITKFHKAAGMTQVELGRAVGVSTQALPDGLTKI